MTENLLDSEAESAVIFAHVGLVLSRMADAGMFDRPSSSAIPKAALTCGEAAVFVPLLFVMLAQRYPQLSDPDALSELLHGAWLNSAGGKPN